VHVDFDIVWDVVTASVPPLVPKLEKIAPVCDSPETI
jgi:uncharacterized protein with HEPN domain